MAQSITNVANRPAWVDLSSPDPEASRAFYSGLFGWEHAIEEDPQYGGYGLARKDGKDVAGIGGKATPEQPTVWMLYVGTDRIEDLARSVEAAGGMVAVQPFAIGDQGRIAVFQDPVGAFFSAWEPISMSGFGYTGSNAFGWAELNARGVEGAIPFYEQVFGWTVRTSPMGEGQPDYTEFLLDGESVVGALEMNPMVPAEVPSYWQVYFMVDDVDGTFSKALEAGGTEMVAPQDFPGGRFAIVSDPHGASFGLLRLAEG